MLWIRVDLKNSETPFGTVRCRQFKGGETTSADLSIANQEALRGMVQRIEQQGGDVVGESRPVIDGRPCSLKLLRKAPNPMLTYNLNLAGYPNTEDLPIVPALCGRLLGIASLLSATN